MSLLLLARAANNHRPLPGVTSRYWRIYATSTEASGAAAGYINCTLIALNRTEGDGINQVPIVGGTFNESSFYDGRYKSEQAWLNTKEDGTTNQMYFWHSASQGAPWWTSLDCGTGKSITARELVLIGTNVPTRMPKDFVVQTSANGTVWDDVVSFTGITGWSINAKKVFPLI